MEEIKPFTSHSFYVRFFVDCHLIFKAAYFLVSNACNLIFVLLFQFICKIAGLIAEWGSTVVPIVHRSSIFECPKSFVRSTRTATSETWRRREENTFLKQNRIQMGQKENFLQ